MNRILLLCLFWAIFVPNKLFSQGKVNVDSLTNVLNKYPKEDTVKVKMLISLATEYQKSDTQKAREYAENAIKISEQLGYDFWIGKAYYAKGNVLLRMGDLMNAKLLCEKAVAIFDKNNKYINDLGMGIFSLGQISERGGDFATALKHYDEALKIFTKIQDEKGQVNVNIAVGRINLHSGNLEEALAIYQSIQPKCEKLNNLKALSQIYSNMAIIHYRLGNFGLSIENSFKAIAIVEYLGDIGGLAVEHNNLGLVYNDLGDKQEARKYFGKALDFNKKLNAKYGIINAMLNITTTYDDNQKAIEELKKTLEYCKEINNKHLLASIYQNLAARSYNLKNHKAAYDYAQQGLEIAKEVQQYENIIHFNNSLADIFLDCSDEDLRSFGIDAKDRYEKVKEYLDKVFTLAKGKSTNSIMYAWVSLSKLYENTENYAEAYKSYQKYIELKDSITNDNNHKQITRKEIQYEFDKKETELKFQQQLTAGELEKQKLLTFQQEQALALNRQTLTLKEQALTLSNKDLLLATKEKDLAHLAYLKEQAEKQEKEQQLSLSQEREKGKELDLKLKSAALFSKNLELSAKQKQNLFLIALATLLLLGLGTLLYFYNTLKKQKNIIAQQNELNEHTISILSHDIKEPLLGVKLLLKKLNKDDPFVAQASQSLENQINSVNSILTNLLRMKKLALNKKDKNASANVNEAILNVLQDLSIAVKNKELVIQNELSPNITLPIAPEKLQIILHNLLSNAVKYSFSHQNIRIFQEGKGICIQDFGVGLSPEQRSKIMREVTASQKGTNQERGNGLGLFLVGAMLQGEQIRVVFDAPEVGGTIAKVIY